LKCENKCKWPAAKTSLKGEEMQHHVAMKAFYPANNEYCGLAETLMSWLMSAAYQLWKIIFNEKTCNGYSAIMTMAMSANG